jgi:hypothetical protein
MSYRVIAAWAASSCILFAAAASAQPGNRHLAMEARVLDVVFPINLGSEPYHMKMVLRFGDSITQITVVIYPGGEGELIRHTARGIGQRELSQLISQMVAERSDVTEQEIAAKLKVDISRSPIELRALKGALDELKSIRVSPVLTSRVALGQCSEYEFWYDTWQEAVRYTILGPFKDGNQDRLVAWMIKFRSNLPRLLKGPTAR